MVVSNSEIHISEHPRALGLKACATTILLSFLIYISVLPAEYLYQCACSTLVGQRGCLPLELRFQSESQCGSWELILLAVYLYQCACSTLVGQRGCHSLELSFQS